MLDFLFLSTFAVLGLIGLRLWRSAFCRMQKREPILESRAQIPSPFGLIDVTIMFVTWAVGQIGSATFALWLLRIEPKEMAQADSSRLAVIMVIVAIGQLIATGIGIGIIGLRYRRWEIFGWQPAQGGRDFLIGGVAFLMVVPVVLLIQWVLSLVVTYHHSTLDVISDNPSFLVLACTWFAAVLAAPICEELFFRGVFQSWLQRLVRSDSVSLENAIGGGWDEAVGSTEKGSRNQNQFPDDGEQLTVSDDCGPQVAFPTRLIEESGQRIPVPRSPTSSWMPIVVSAAFFGLVHLGQGAAPIPLFVFGLALGYLYRQTGSILPCILLHMGLNGFSMGWYTLNVFFDNLPAAG